MDDIKTILSALTKGTLENIRAELEDAVENSPEEGGADDIKQALTAVVEAINAKGDAEDGDEE